MIRVLVVDDSPSVRELLMFILGSDPGIEIVGSAADGEEAIRMAQATKPNVISMDLHMPNVDGFEATRRIMETCPTPIVIVSGSEDPSEVGASFRAIEAGALVIVQRPVGVGHPAFRETASALIRTVKSMAEVKVVRRWSKTAGRTREQDAARPAETERPARKLVLIGASTGGPAVLRDILAELPAGYPLPLLIVQHMSAGFLDGFAQWLSSASGFPVRVAEHGEGLVAGCAYLAPDGYQVAVTRDMRIALSRGRSEHGMCPSVSHLFRSVHKDICPATIAVLLTGMGKDGAHELRQLKEHGAVTIVQDRATSVVYGMPGEAIRQDAARLILAPPDIGKMLRGLGQEPQSDFPYLGD
ncbi:MAG TPA: chemotaxis-specific protein-glutamate methyltransferase CheB [Noviherbaspirillum sp.]|nr:chemotaxis-specific protein-glutamate methyltransferase CheB [Noviherbaspirillum sp.]